MNNVPAYVAAVRFIAKVGAAVGAGGFWGMTVALVIKELLHINGDAAMFYVALPVTAVFVLFIWPRLPKILGFDR
jgi:hypothetical protein